MWMRCREATGLAMLADFVVHCPKSSAAYSTEISRIWFLSALHRSLAHLEALVRRGKMRRWRL